MNRKLALFVATLALLVTAAASAETIRVRANVPFSFIVNRATMPAGEYQVESVDAQGMVLAIHNLDSPANGLIMSSICESRKPTKNTKLVFHRYGDRYFLTQVWLQGNKTGHALPISPREKEVAMDFSMQEVVLMAKGR